LIVVAIAASATAFALLTDVGLFFVYAGWAAPVVVLIPYAYPSAERRSYGLGTVVAALVLPVAVAVWVLWLVVIHAH
jgi:hypothetical protein